MAQRILEPGEIETLAQSSIPRLRLTDPSTLFMKRAARLRRLATPGGMGAYLRFLAHLVDAQHAAMASLSVSKPAAELLSRSAAHGMPPIHAASWPRPERWRSTLTFLCESLASHAEFPQPVQMVIDRIRRSPPAWLEGQADALLQLELENIDTAAAPWIMAALQVQWVALAATFHQEPVMPLDVPGLCPLCGTPPVASRVCANSPYQGYRYLHCGLCATEWHMVRVQCSICAASGKSIAYHSAANQSQDTSTSATESAVRAETCEECQGYRKILYEEKDIEVDPVADDLASLSLDVLLSEAGYHRGSSNPLLWRAAAE